MLAPTLADIPTVAWLQRALGTRKDVSPSCGGCNAQIFQTASCWISKKMLVSDSGEKIQDLQLATFTKGSPSHVGIWIYHDGRGCPGLHESCQGFHRLPWGNGQLPHDFDVDLQKKKYGTISMQSLRYQITPRSLYEFTLTNLLKWLVSLELYL